MRQIVVLQHEPIRLPTFLQPSMRIIGQYSRLICAVLPFPQPLLPNILFGKLADVKNIFSSHPQHVSFLGLSHAAKPKEVLFSGTLEAI